jgi:hypothetical protein
MDAAANERLLDEQKQASRRTLNFEHRANVGHNMFLVMLVYGVVEYASLLVPAAWLPVQVSAEVLASGVDYRMAMALSFPKLLDGLLNLSRGDDASLMHNLVSILCTFEYVLLAFGLAPVYVPLTQHHTALGRSSRTASHSTGTALMHVFLLGTWSTAVPSSPRVFSPGPSPRL